MSDDELASRGRAEESPGTHAGLTHQENAGAEPGPDNSGLVPAAGLGGNGAAPGVAADPGGVAAGPGETAGLGTAATKPGAGEVPPPTGSAGRRDGGTARALTRRLPPSAGRWLSIFGVSLVLFLIRFLVPTPVGQADNRDGPRLMCGLGVGPVTHGYPRFFRFAYFQYVPKTACNGRVPYPSSELVPLVIAKFLTPVFALPGTLNLIALGVLLCVIASAGIASLATGLRVRLWAQLVVAAIVWLIVADAAFFDVFASPFSEPAALVGLLLVAAGVLYLGRGWRATVSGLILAGAGGFLAILSKEQYLVLAVPICVTIVLASASSGPWRSLRRFRTREAKAAIVVSALLVVLTGGYFYWNYTTHYGQRLEHIQAVDMIFTDIVTTPANAPAGLRALGLPASWAKYAGHYYWDKGSVRNNRLLPRYYGKLTDTNITRYLLTHPGSIVSIGQKSATQAQLLRVTTLGDYPQSAGHPLGAYESRVIVLTWLAQRLPRHLGLLLYIPLWLVMAALGIVALRRRARPWHRDGAVLVLCMTACAMMAFVPPAYFAGISTTRHMVGTNLATALALTMSVALAVSLIYGAATGSRRRPETPAAPAELELAKPGV
ncbi:MAG TPA: hypothetical protein VG123_34865 [Streptosporangiaceae bacterium]|nr:hypothetical protein [Streptosporangiaceae bacterium]